MSAVTAAPRLGRAALAAQGGPAHEPPVRMVHLGLGAFHRAHQAWYTARAADAADWGIAAYTMYRPDIATALTEQGGVYTLVQRGAAGDRVELVGSIVRAVPGSEVADLVRTLADPAVAVLTLTVTEKGHHLDPSGRPDLTDPAVDADLACLRVLIGDPAGAAGMPQTPLGRVLFALDARRRAQAPPLAIVPCDNLPGNGALVRQALETLAAEVSPDLASWLAGGISVVSTSVDRITPRLDVSDADVHGASGWFDAAPVVTEPFSDWVLCGEFPSGRPAWETAGARFVDDLAPWEDRKLWLLNGAHTLLAALGPLRGHRTVADAIADPVCRSAVGALWDEAAAHLPDVDVDRYRDALLDRFANPGIAHLLAQIAEDSFTKLRLRIVPVAVRERAAGRPAKGCATAVAAWILASGRTPSSALLAELDPALGADDRFCAEVDQASHTLASAVAPLTTRIP